MTELQKLEINANQAGADLVSVKQAIQDNGVEVPDGTRTSKYGELIGDVYDSGHESGYDTGYDEGHEAGYSAGQSSMVDESKLIPKTVSGSYISVDDVSEIPHSVGCKVESVNLLFNKQGNLSHSTAYKQAEWTVNDDGTINVVATVGNDNSDYYFFGSNVDNEDAFVAEEDMTISTNSFDDETVVCALRLDTGYQQVTNEKRNAWTIPAGTKVYGVFLRIHNTTVNKQNIWVMFNRGITALPYTPYVSPESVKVKKCGKNLFDIDAKPSIENTRYTFTKINDNTIRSTTSIAEGYLGKMYIGTFDVGTTLCISGHVAPSEALAAAGGVCRLPWWCIDENGNVLSIDYTISSPYTVSGDFTATYTVLSGRGADRYKVYFAGGYNLLYNADYYVDFTNLQIELGDKATEYEPYNGQTLTPNTDGTVEGMTSVSPYMNVFSDTEGVNIEVEYNKSYGMQTEYDRFWDNLQDYGKRVGYTYGFMGSSWNDTTFRPKYNIDPDWSIVQTFANSKITDLEKILNECGVSLITRRNGNYTSTFGSAAFTVLPHITFGSATSNASQTFGSSASLHTIRKITIEDGATAQFTTTFYGCIALANVEFDGVIPTNINFQWCPLTKASITSIIEHLSPTVTGQTLTLKLSAVNTAFETSSGAGDGSTSAEFAALVATKTNWTITMI